MIKHVLAAYSEGDLYQFICPENVEQYKKIINRELSKADLVLAVEALAIEEILLDDVKRAQFIERMPLELIDQVLRILFEGNSSEQLNVLSQKPQVKYNGLIKLANSKLVDFLRAIDCEKILSSQDDSAKSVQGIALLSPQYPMYPYQEAIVRKVNALIGDAKPSCLIHLPTGAGKTRTAMNIVSEHLRQNPKGLVLWLADTEELCAQAAAEFSKAWSALGSREIKLYGFYSDADISLGGIDSGFLVASLQKLNATRKSDTQILYQMLRQHVTLIVFDEAHKAIAPTYKQTVNDMLGDNNQAFLLGLSATPGRSIDGQTEADQQLSAFFNEKKVTMKVAGYLSPIDYLVEEGYLAKAHFHTIEYQGNQIIRAEQFENQSVNAQIREALSEDEQRNLELIRVIKAEHAQDSSIIVFSCSIEHSRALASMLAFEGIKAYSLDSDADSKEARRFKISQYMQGKVKVLINYNILTAGFDAPITNVAIIARPTDSLVQYSQMAGRAMRGIRSRGHEDCRVYTVRDDIPAFRSVIHAFAHWDQLWTEV